MFYIAFCIKIMVIQVFFFFFSESYLIINSELNSRHEIPGQIKLRISIKKELSNILNFELEHVWCFHLAVCSNMNS